MDAFDYMNMADWLFRIVCWLAFVLLIAQFCGTNGKDDDE